MSFLKKFIKSQQDEVKKENMTVGDARIALLKAAMMSEAGKLQKSGVDVPNLPKEELREMLKQRLKEQQESGEAKFPYYDWYLEVFKPQNAQIVVPRQESEANSENQPDFEALKKIAAEASADLQKNKKDIITISCSVNESLAYLYAAFHLPNANSPEYAVFNPNPMHFVKGYALPRDLYFWKESNDLAPMEFEDFKRACKGFIRSKGVHQISTIAGLDAKDKLRLTAVVKYEVNGNVPTAATLTLTVSGGLPKECETLLNKTYGAMCQAARNLMA